MSVPYDRLETYKKRKPHDWYRSTNLYDMHCSTVCRFNDEPKVAMVNLK